MLFHIIDRAEEDEDEEDEDDVEDEEDEKGDVEERVGITVFLKAFAVTAAGTYPFIVLVSSLSSIDLNKFVPCSEQNPCSVVKLIGDEYLPSTINYADNPFVIVKNGHEPVGNIPNHFVPPTCPGNSSHDMTTLCASPDVKKSIKNTMSKGFSKTAYISSIISWSLCKILHDFLLLCGAKELLTLQVGLTSVFFQLLAVASAFIWSMGAAEVFIAPIASANCGCYFQLGDIETLLAIATPVVLYKICSTKLEAIFRAAISGDFLYFIQYDVPHYLVTQSMSDPSASYLIATTRGTQAASRRPQIPLQQLRSLFESYSRVNFWICSVVQNACVGIAAGPVAERLIQLGISNIGSMTGCLLVCLSILLLVISAAVATYIYMKKLFDFQVCEFRAAFWDWRLWTRFKFVSYAIFGSIAIWMASTTLIIPLITELCGGVVEIEPNNVCRWACAGFACFFFGVAPVMNDLKFPAQLAFAMKARYPWSPSEYMSMAKRPEFGCAEEIELAARFLQSRSGSFSAKGDWKKTLSWSPPLCSTYGLTA